VAPGYRGLINPGPQSLSDPSVRLRRSQDLRQAEVHWRHPPRDPADDPVCCLDEYRRPKIQNHDGNFSNAWVGSQEVLCPGSQQLLNFIERKLSSVGGMFPRSFLSNEAQEKYPEARARIAEVVSKEPAPQGGGRNTRARAFQERGLPSARPQSPDCPYLSLCDRPRNCPPDLASRYGLNGEAACFV
jgi:hypothetical protein